MGRVCCSLPLAFLLLPCLFSQVALVKRLHIEQPEKHIQVFDAGAKLIIEYHDMCQRSARLLIESFQLLRQWLHAREPIIYRHTSLLLAYSGPDPCSLPGIPDIPRRP